MNQNERKKVVISRLFTCHKIDSTCIPPSLFVVSNYTLVSSLLVTLDRTQTSTSSNGIFLFISYVILTDQLIIY